MTLAPHDSQFVNCKLNLSKIGHFWTFQFWIFSAFLWNWTFTHCTEVRFANFLSGGFTTMAEINPSETKQAKRTSVAVCYN